MTLTPISIDPTAELAHMSPRALLAHITAAVTCLARDGVVISGEVTVGLDALDECVLEHEHRTGRLPPVVAGAAPRAGFLHVVTAADVGGGP